MMAMRSIVLMFCCFSLAHSAGAQQPDADYVITGYFGTEVRFREVLTLEFQDNDALAGSLGSEMAISGSWHLYDDDDHGLDHQVVRMTFDASDGVATFVFVGWLQPQVGIWGRWSFSSLGISGGQLAGTGAFEARYIGWENWPP